MSRRLFAIVFVFLLFRLPNAFAQTLLSNTQPSPKPVGAQVMPAHLQPTFVVVDECTKVRQEIEGQARRLLVQRDYKGLTAMAQQLRNDQRTFAQGSQPFDYFFTCLSKAPDNATEPVWQARLEGLKGWLESDPDGVTPRVALADALVGYAWTARGFGYANSVAEQQWEIFGERIAEARRLLANVDETEFGKAQEFCVTRLGIALVDHTPRDQYEELFQKAAERFPTYVRLYCTKAYYLLPRWHGEPGEWERFVKDSADKIGGEDGDVFYAQVIWKMHALRCFGNIFSESAADWPRTQRGFEALHRRYPNSISAPSEYCYLAGFAPSNARTIARSLLNYLNNRVDLSVWGSPEKFAQDRSWALAATN